MEWLVLVIVLLIAIPIAYQKWAEKQEEKNCKPSAPPRSESIKEIVQANAPKPIEYPDNISQLKKQQAWDAYTEIIKVFDKLIQAGGLESIEIEVRKYLGKTDAKRDAMPQHLLLGYVTDTLYKKRDEIPLAVDMCLMLCDLDIKNTENLLNTEKSPFYMYTPSRKAIILEKRGDIDGAIAVCDQAIKWNLLDESNKSFAFRRDRLQKRLEKLAK